MQNFIKNLNDNHKESMIGIEKYLNSENKELSALLNYIIGVREYASSLLPKGYEYALSSSSHFYSFCKVLNNALNDDGDISFPIINGSPKMFFIDIKSTPHLPNYKGNIDGFCKDGFDFIKKSKEHFISQLKFNFLMDMYVNPNSIEVINDYKLKHPNDFNPDWIP